LKFRYNECNRTMLLAAPGFLPGCVEQYAFEEILRLGREESIELVRAKEQVRLPAFLIALVLRIFCKPPVQHAPWRSGRKKSCVSLRIMEVCISPPPPLSEESCFILGDDLGLDEEAEDTLLLRLYTGEFDRTAAVYATPEQRQAQSAQVGEEADGQAKSRKRKLRYSSDEESEEDEEDTQGPTAKRVRVRSNVPTSV